MIGSIRGPMSTEFDPSSLLQAANTALIEATLVSQMGPGWSYWSTQGGTQPQEGKQL